MSKRVYEDLRDMLKQEIGAITKKGDLTKESLDNLHKLTSTLKSVEYIMQEEESEGSSHAQGGYSQRYNPYMPYGMSYGGGMSNGQSYNQSYDYSRDGGQSYRGSYDQGSYARQGRDGDSDGQYSEDGGSYARRRDSRGRYSSDGNAYGYSRHTQTERMIEKLESMMDTATTEKERKAIERCITQLES